MAQREKSLGSSFPNKSWPRRRPMPSMVSYRFDAACEKAVIDSANAKAARLLHYKNLLLKSGASQDEIKCVEDSLSSLEDTSIEEQPNFINSSKADDKDQLKMLSSTPKRIFPNGKPRLPAHLQHTKPLNINTPLESESSVSKSPESSINPLSSTPSSTGKMFQKKSLGDYLYGGVTLPENDLSSIYCKTPVNKGVDDLTSQMEKCRITSLDKMECICIRKVDRTICLSCGEIMNGRVFRRCQMHPKIAFLSDHFNCIKCYTDTSLLHEINE